MHCALVPCEFEQYGHDEDGKFSFFHVNTSYIITKKSEIQEDITPTSESLYKISIPLIKIFHHFMNSFKPSY